LLPSFHTCILTEIIVISYCPPSFVLGHLEFKRERQTDRQTNRKEGRKKKKRKRKERKGKERKGKERKGKERKGKERKGEKTDLGNIIPRWEQISMRSKLHLKQWDD
jgi:hypothetical protein